MFKYIFGFGLLLIAAGVSMNIYDLQKGGDYEKGIMTLGMNSTAHLMCSCLFVSENDEEFCRDYAALKQVQPWIRVNYETKIVDARLFLFFSGRAQHIGNNSGCSVLD